MENAKVKSKLSLIVTVFLFSSVFGFAQDDAYRSDIYKIVEKTSDLADALNSNSIDFNWFDRWLNDFKKVSSGFEQRYKNVYKQKKSFQETRDGLDGLSLAWTLFKQAQYAESQYRESITLDQVTDAQKWKSQATSQRKKGIEDINKAIESLRDAKNYSENTE